MRVRPCTALPAGRVGVAVMSHDDVFAHNFRDKRQPQLNFFPVNNRTLVDNIHTSVLLRSTIKNTFKNKQSCWYKLVI